MVNYVVISTYPLDISKDISPLVSKVKKDKKLSFLTGFTLFNKLNYTQSLTFSGSIPSLSTINNN